MSIKEPVTLQQAVIELQTVTELADKILQERREAIALLKRCLVECRPGFKAELEGKVYAFLEKIK